MLQASARSVMRQLGAITRSWLGSGKTTFGRGSRLIDGMASSYSRRAAGLVERHGRRCVMSLMRWENEPASPDGDGRSAAFRGRGRYLFMALIMFKCPVTGTDVSTAESVKPEALEATAFENASFRCSSCGQVHKWSKEEVWIGLDRY